MSAVTVAVSLELELRINTDPPRPCHAPQPRRGRAPLHTVQLSAMASIRMQAHSPGVLQYTNAGAVAAGAAARRAGVAHGHGNGLELQQRELRRYVRALGRMGASAQKLLPSTPLPFS